MSLKQSIVIRSEYTNNARSAPGKGSRGASPGQYVMQYMAREDATEVLPPVRIPSPIATGMVGVSAEQKGYDSAAFTRYMARSTATEQLKMKDDEDLQDVDSYGSSFVLKHKFRNIDKLSGRAFGSRGISLSHEELKASSEAIQEAFDDGHSVQKIILSFTEEYLLETGVLDPSFKHKGRGSYKGHIDQLKLRQAVIQGVNNMTKTGRFINPEWVGTIQLDTSHVHAHIALADKEFSKYRMKEDGADRGKINEREKKMFRKGIHFCLEAMKQLKSFHKQASLERQNVVAFVKDYTYSTLRENALVQVLMASLPKNRQHWRYGTNRKSMKYPNQLAKGIVERLFKTDPEKSGYKAAMKSVQDYADESTRKNKLTKDEKQALIHNGREQIVERSVNGLYKTLKEINPATLQTRTVMIDIQSSSDEDLTQALKSSDKSKSFDPAAFALRVRGYNKRQEIHSSSAKDFFALSREYDTAQANGLVDDTAHVMRLFYEEEQRYHMGLADKYRTFLVFRHPRDRENVENMRPMYEELTDRYHRMVSDEVRTGVTHHQDREVYKRDLREYTFACFERGVASLKEWDAIMDYDGEKGTLDTRFVLPVRPKTGADNLNANHFNQVKAWDVHHLGLDYYNKSDARIDSKNALAFADRWQMREQRAMAARTYVDSTNQSLHALHVAEQDIQEMEKVVDKAVNNGLIQTVVLEDLSPEEERQLYTLSVDRSVDVTKRVRNTLEHMEAVEQMEQEELG